jgi:histone-lysine N-methyltransferase SETMAR
MEFIPHPPYSPYLALSDFFLFTKIKLKLKGPRFDTIEKIQAESQRVLDTLTERDFQEAFQKCRRRLDRCLYAGGNYLDGDGGASTNCTTAKTFLMIFTISED